MRTAAIVLQDNPQSISVAIVENRTLEYGAEERVTEALVQEFIRDGRLQVTSRRRADLLLDAKLIRYQMEPVGYNERGDAVVFNLETRLMVSLKDARSGEILFEEESFEDKGVFFLSNQPGERREERVFARLAESVISRLLDGW